MSRIGIIAVTVALAACGGSSSLATQFHSTLSAANESPTTTSSGTGTADYTVIGSVGYTNTGATVSYTVTFSGLTAPATAADIHVGAPGVNGQVTIPLSGQTSGTFNGTFSATNVQAATGGGVSVAAGSIDDLLAAMRAGNTYTNIHTGTFPDGEIRGQNQPQ
jgi:CHRD domain